MQQEQQRFKILAFHALPIFNGLAFLFALRHVSEIPHAGLCCHSGIAERKGMEGTHITCLITMLST
jgi:hypothetical protein